MTSRDDAQGPVPFQAADRAQPRLSDAPHEAFLWSQSRTVTKTATVSLHGNVSTVDAALVGRRVEIVFNPFDLTQVNIRYQGRPMGAGVPHIAADLGQIRLPGP